MDYSDAQMMGLEVSFGKWVLRKQGITTKIKSGQADAKSNEFVLKARAIGITHTNQHAKGCVFHYRQSVQRVSQLISTDGKEQRDFAKVAKQLLTDKAADFLENVNYLRRTFPKSKTWLEWWIKPAHARLVFESQMTMSAETQAVMPTTNNILEAFNRVFQLVLPRQHLPIYLAVTMAYFVSQNLQNLETLIHEGRALPSRKRGLQGAKTGNKLSLLASAEVNQTTHCVVYVIERNLLFAHVLKNNQDEI